MNEYESKLAKARKLAAMANDPSASHGERENASALLKAHCAKFGITAEAMDSAARQKRVLECVSPRRASKPIKLKDLVILAEQCLCYVVGEDRQLIYSTDTVMRPQRGLKPDKEYKIFSASAFVTGLEYDEWRACFHHYVDDFLEMRLDLQRQVRVAQQASKLGLKAFISKHGIYSSDQLGGDQKAEKQTPEKLAAYLQALRGVAGSQFQTGRQKLEEKDFHLQ